MLLIFSQYLIKSSVATVYVCDDRRISYHKTFVRVEAQIQTDTFPSAYIYTHRLEKLNILQTQSENTYAVR